MDAKLLYWTGALINMGAVAGCALVGARQIGAGNPRLHRRLMSIAALLVCGFVVSYGFKLHFLGREDLSIWSATAIWVLRVHEVCVAGMLIGGGLSLFWSRQLRRTRSFSLDAADPLPAPGLVERHRWAGRVAIGAAVLGFLSAILVLAGMFSRVSS
jgi:uncharacterized membrane protein YozB (DUF420 family)